MNGIAFKIGWFALHLAFVAALAAPGPVWAGPGPGEKDPPAKAAVKGGQTIRVKDAKVGAEGHYLIRVPTDYTPDRTWPTIFCYHGLGGNPTVWPFDQLTGNKGFIIVGMPYWQKGLEGYRQRDKDIANLKFIFKQVCSRVNVDKKMVFAGGFSKGGWYASIMLAAAPRTWAGAIILGAGRDRASPDPARKISGMPIFIGVGEKEKNVTSGRGSADYYRSRGAKVTFEEWKGLGHSVNMKSKLLRDWLADNGPMRIAAKLYAAARKAEQARRLGRAYKIYHHLAGMSETNETCKKADAQAKAIAGKAEEGLAAAQKHVSQKQYAQAAKALARLARLYAGSRFADQADKQLDVLRKDPEIQRVIEQANTDDAADALEAKAQKAEQDKDYAKAMRLYEQYVKTHAKAKRFEQVRKHLATLKADGSLAGKIKQRAADKQAAKWLKMANNYINAGMKDKAKPYLKKIIAQYGDTTWGPKAEVRLDDIGG